VPFAALLFGAVAVFVPLLVQRRPAAGRAVTCGVLLGLATLVRSIALGLGGVLAAVLVAAGRGPRARRGAVAVCLVAANVATLAPWVAWATVRTGVFVPVSTGGPPSVRDGLTFAVRTKGYRAAVDVPPGVRALMTRIEGRAAELRSTGGIARVVAEEVARRPAAGVHLLAWKLVRSWYATDSGRGERVALAVHLALLPLVVAATRRAALGRRAERALALTAWAVAVYCWMMTVVVLSIVRYLVPAVGVLLALVPVLWPAARGRRRRARDQRAVGSSRLETTGVPSPCQPSVNPALSGRSLNE